MKFKVTAIAVDLTTRPFSYSAPREEIVDTQENTIFGACESIQKVLMVEPVELN